MRVRIATAAILCCLLGAGTAGAAPGTSASGHRLTPPQRERATAGASSPSAHRRRHPFQFPAQGPCQGGFCWTPGEPVIAVGPTEILETVNTAATVYNKTTGAQLAEFDFASFWDGSGTMSCVDPRALYLPTGQFAFSCTDTATGGPMRFAISKTTDPAIGGWWVYAAPNTTSLDQDKIESTSDKFIIAGNTDTNEQIYVYNLSQVTSGVTHPQVKKLTATKSNLYEAAVEQTSASPGYLVASFPGQPLDLATITGTPAAANAKLKEQAIQVQDFPAPQEPQVPGGAIGGGDLDGRIYDAVYEQETSDSKPVIQFSSSRECGARTCLTSGRIDLSGTKPKLSSYQMIGEPGFDYSYGAVGLDAQGNVFEAYTRSSATQGAGAAVLGPGFDISLQPAAAGTTPCSGGWSPPCDERWGDYLGTAIDPSNPSVVWVTGLYQATSGSFGWGTTIAKVSLTSFSLPTVTTGSAKKIKAASATLTGTVNPNGVATTYHIDYGLTTGYDSSTTEAPVGSGATPVSVSGGISGLQPGTLYHYRVVATTATGSADGPDRTFRTKAPAITGVTFTGTPSDPTVTITGTNLPTAPTPDPSEPLNCTAGDTSFDYGATGLWFEDSTQGWTGGQIGDCIGLILGTHTASTTSYQFGPFYSNFNPVTNGDSYTLMVDGVTLSGLVAYS